MSQTDRKYDGPTVQELKQPPCPPMPPNYGKRRPRRPREDVHRSDVWAGWGIGWKALGWDEKSYSPFLGRKFHSWTRRIYCQHVVKRFRAVVMKDERMGICWLQDQATKEAISPEFSSQECLLNWLEYEGLSRGWLVLEVYRYYKRGEEKPITGVRVKQC